MRHLARSLLDRSPVSGRTIDRLQKLAINPLDRLAFALGAPPPGDALIETIGRRTGRARVTPVCDGLDGDTFWIIAQHGHDADYVRNLEANPRVRVKGSLSHDGWRAGTAHVLDDDDPEERVRILSSGNRWRRLCLQASTSVGTSPLTVRVDLDAEERRADVGAEERSAVAASGGCGRALDPAVFAPASVPAATAEAIEALRRAGAATGALSVTHLDAMRAPHPDRPGPLRVEPRSEDAVEHVIYGPGGPLRLHVLAPGAVRACYLHLHGGGWTFGAGDDQDQTLSQLARAAGVAVVSLDYRLAPEHPHPAAVEDCVAAIRWLIANGARELGCARVVVGAESAGANVAALALLALRDRGELASVVAASLAYGVYDVSMTPSARRWGDERIVISTRDLAFYADQYAPPARRRDPDVSPLYADLRDLPPALFTVGTGDPLLDDSLFMAARWQAAGNDARLSVFPGAPHELLNLRNPIAAEQEARARIVSFLDGVLGG
ncbi:MAG TPA: nitroreductase/quinone reductase family protein [Conexibacter sp.]|jgi:deazaflavin-dependent oxidoreductase (nitroreductase family)